MFQGLNCVWQIPAQQDQYVNVVFREPFDIQCEEQCSLDYIKITKGLVAQEPQENGNRRRRKRQTDGNMGSECDQSMFNFAALGVANSQIIPLGDNVIGR